MQRILPPVAKLCLALMCAVLFVGTAAAQTQTTKDQGWSYPTEKPTDPFDGGDGSESNPYRIRTAQQLMNLAWMVNDGKEYEGKYFLMTDDIVLNENVINADGTFNRSGSFKDCVGIGHYNTFVDDDFGGIFDGGGHTIYGFYRNIGQDEKEHYTAALFYGLDNAIVQNLTISDSYIYNFQEDNFGCEDGTGFVVGTAYKSTISSCHVKHSVIESCGYGTRAHGKHCRFFSVGGIAGIIEKSSVKDCSFSGNINVGPSGIEEDTYVSAGGIVGSMQDNYDNTIANCLTEGDIKYSCKYSVIEEYIGGIVGFADKNFRISGCCNKMNLYSVEAGGTLLGMGGILGFLDCDGHSYIIERCVNFGDIYWGTKGKDYITKWTKLFGGIGTLKPNSMTTDGDLWLTDCANYGSVHVLYDKVTISKKEEKDEKALDDHTLTAGCLAICGTFGMHTRTYFTRCISVADKHELNTGTGLKLRFAPIMGYLYRDRLKDDEPDIKTIDDCYYYTDASTCRLHQPTHLKGVAAPHSLAKTAFRKTQPWTASPFNAWRPLAEGESDAWTDYTVPVIRGLRVQGYEGHGTPEEPYLIYTENDLANLSQFLESNLNANFRLMNDLYMADKPAVTSIKEELNYKGTIDGNGHFIDGLRVTGHALFEKLSGTVKNLTLTNFRGNETTTYNTSIASSLYGTIENCAVYGTISASRSSNFGGETVHVSGIAYTVYDDGYYNGCIKNCVFKGTFKASPLYGDTEIEGTKTRLRHNGICEEINSTYKKASVTGCYASYTIEGVDAGFYEIITYGIGNNNNGTMANNYFVCPQMTTNTFYYKQDGVTKAESEADITPAMLGDTNEATWLQGAYGPVNKHTKHLTVTDPAGQPTNLDYCYDASWTPNKVYTLTLTKDNADDAMLMRFRNLALYNKQTQTSYIIRLMLDRDGQRFEYTPVSGCTATKGATRLTIKKDEALAGAPGHYLLCLPCPLRTADLPEGSVLHGLGYAAGNEESFGKKSVFYLTECDSVGAGEPCHVYIPDCVSGDFTLLSYGDIVSAPKVSGTYGLQAYFAPQTVSNVYHGILLATGSQTPEYLTYTSGDTQMKLFDAAATSKKYTERQQLSIRRVISEDDPYLAETLAGLHGPAGNSFHIYLKRKLYANEWNTITLPFTLFVANLKKKSGDNNIVAQELQSIATDANGALTLTFTDVTLLEAGKPYLIKPSIDCDGFDLDGEYLTINATTTTVKKTDGTNEVNMIPYYVPLVLVEGDYFLQGNKFYVVAEGMTVKSKGMRARFTANAAASEALQSARLVFDNGDVTGIDGIARPAAATNGAVYDLSGRRVEKPAHGLYIVNGRKVLLP